MTKTNKPCYWLIFLPYVAIVVIDEIPEGLPLILDKDDRMFLILPVARGVDVLVSEDADILQLKDSFLHRQL